eukprot:5102238-Pleurochrysis_carterae.AAC.3
MNEESTRPQAASRLLEQNTIRAALRTCLAFEDCWKLGKLDESHLNSRSPGVLPSRTCYPCACERVPVIDRAGSWFFMAAELMSIVHECVGSAPWLACSDSGAQARK